MKTSRIRKVKMSALLQKAVEMKQKMMQMQMQRIQKTRKKCTQDQLFEGVLEESKIDHLVVLESFDFRIFATVYFDCNVPF
mmetsp:Transcript_11143/g.16422  ORF Transcript_11143/g.16422 Transcript_11143/m.16422 type:complete len:81 (+) Transcript_11143:1338-1580(+)